MDVPRAARRAARKAAALEPSRLYANALVQLNVLTHRTWALPILLYAVTSRCNSRCVSCDYWKSDGASDLRVEEVAAIARDLPALGVKLVVLTGGEPLVRQDFFELADLFRAQGVALHLLTSGLALERHAEAVAKRFAAVTVSLDGHTPELYRAVRGVDGLQAVERGVQRLRELRPELTVTARSTLHRRNFRALPHLIEKAAEMGLTQISFLAADVASEAFGRQLALESSSNTGLLLDDGEVDELERVIEKAIARHGAAFQSGQVAESPEKLRRIGRYYRARRGGGPFPVVACNAPWASAVIEADGTLRPCFFQPPVGSVRQRSLRALLDDEMVRFRKGLDVASDVTCQTCVCSLRVGMRSRVW